MIYPDDIRKDGLLKLKKLKEREEYSRPKAEIVIYDIFQKAGRLSNGNQADHGSINHAVIGSAEWCKGKALCGTEPGKRSVGWVKPFNKDAKVTCEKCLRKLESV